MTDEQLALDLYAELYGDYELDADFRPTRLWHRGSGLASVRTSCLWRPVETVALAPAGVL